MITITLLNGSTLQVNANSTALDVANAISPSLAKNAYFAIVNGNQQDLLTPITTNSKVEIITAKNETEALSVIRHSLAHLMAMAVRQLFPNTKVATGPVTENGWFYDLYPPEPFKESDLQAIEQRMAELIDQNISITRYETTKQQAVSKYTKEGETFKIDVLNTIPEETVSFYKQAEFEDLCRGPHVLNTKQLPKAFKLTKLSGVYWQGNKQNPMLQRISGVAFLNKKDLDQYLTLQAELEKNDHRKLGVAMDLFHMQEEAVGGVFWHHNGYAIYRNLENYIREKIFAKGYTEVKTPLLINRKLWEDSGHWSKYKDNMFVVKDNNQDDLALKPMNCPAHVQIFKQGTKSYKDLPIRMSEFGCCHRNESSGSLHGIMRVRGFVQDDAHIFCTKEQIVQESVAFCQLVKEVYTDIFGEHELIVKFSDRPEQRVGSDEVWDEAEQSLVKAAEHAGLEIVLNKADGAFYGPKLEFTLKDTFGRQWQLGTLQMDFVLPQRLGAYYVAEDGNKHNPIMLHRAILGSLERFIGLLLEHYKGKLPLWLSANHIVLMGVINKFDTQVKHINNLLLQNNIASFTDLRAEKINYKIREHSLAKVPLIGIIGEKEIAENTITIRILGSNNQHTLNLDDFIAMVKNNIALKQTEFVVK